MVGISVANRKPAYRLLQRLTVAMEPLRIEEGAEVLAVDFDAKRANPKFNVVWSKEDQERAVLSVCSSDHCCEHRWFQDGAVLPPLDEGTHTAFAFAQACLSRRSPPAR